MNNVKGIKINIKEKEMTMKGFDVHAHVKAMHPSANEDDFKPTVIPKQKSKKKDKNEFKRIIWNITRWYSISFNEIVNSRII
jgi:hypothetical protein